MDDNIPDVLKKFTLHVVHPEELGPLKQHTHDPEDKTAGPAGVENWEMTALLGDGGQGKVYMQTCLDGLNKGTTRAVKIIQRGPNGRKRPLPWGVMPRVDVAARVTPRGDVSARDRRSTREVEVMARFSEEKVSIAHRSVLSPPLSYLDADRYLQHRERFVEFIGYYFAPNLSHICIVMEHLPIRDMGSFLRKNGRLPEHEVRQIISQVLEGVNFLHEQHYAHRDIKPGVPSPSQTRSSNAR